MQSGVFEMFNTIGSSVSLSVAEHTSHRLCASECVSVHTRRDLTYYPGNSL